MKGKINVKTIIVMLIVVLIIILGVIGVKTVQTFMTGAAGGNEPKNVSAVSSEDGKTATVSWTTEKETMGVVQYGPNMATLLLTVEESSQSTNHSVTLTNIGPGKTYYYKIVIADTPYDNNGTAWFFKTKGSTVTPTPIPEQKLEPTKTALQPTISVPNGSNCDRNTDYNKDGVIHSFDFNYCSQSSQTTGLATPSATKNCNNVDYNKDAIINSFDRISCLQNKAQ
jgi:hypothetical protein